MRRRPELLQQLADRYYVDTEIGRLREKRYRYKERSHILFRLAGEVASWADVRGYRKVAIGKTTVYEHVAIMALLRGQWPNSKIDHRDGDLQNNRPDNLRFCTAGQKRSSAKHQKVRSLPRNVYASTNPKGSFYVQIRKNGVVHYIGFYKDLEQAAEAAKKAHLALHGAFSIHASDPPNCPGQADAEQVDFARLERPTARSAPTLRAVTFFHRGSV